MRREGVARRHEVSTVPGIVLGLGLGGFVDGIGLHQIAQWHNMGSAVLPPTTLEAMSRNMLWDGWFHVAVWTLTLVGVYLLLRDARAGLDMPGAGAFTGLLILGWGVFNLLEGIVDHHLLEIHHVRDMPVHVPVYDWVFLAVGGLGLMVLGWLLARRDIAAGGAAARNEGGAARNEGGAARNERSAARNEDERVRMAEEHARESARRRE